MSAIKFQSGDQVKVREDLIVGQEYGGQIFTEYMAALKGLTLFIDTVAPKYYWILGDDYTWTDEMLRKDKAMEVV